MSTTFQSTTPATPPAGLKVAVDLIGTGSAPAAGDSVEYVKLDAGATGASLPVSAANPLPVTDAAHTNVTLYAEAVAGAATEALVPLFGSTAFVAGAALTGSSYTVPAGKTLRIHTIILAWVATTTTANTTRLRLRVNTGGAAVLTSPIAFTARMGWESATFIANEAEFQPILIPGGIDIPAGSGVAMTHLEAAANGTIDITVLGYLF